MGGGGENFREPFAAVGEWAEIELPVGMALAQRAGRRLARGAGGEGVLEFVEGEQDAHGGATRRWRAFEGERFARLVEMSGGVSEPRLIALSF